MNRDEKVELVERWFREVWTDGRDDTIDELCRVDAWLGENIALNPTEGREGMRCFRDEVRLAMPDLRVDPVRIVVEEDQVVVWLSCAGTLPAGGLGLLKESNVCFNGVAWLEVRDGKIWGGRNCMDLSLAIAHVNQLKALAKDRASESNRIGD